MSTDGNEVLALDGARPVDPGGARAAAGAGMACAMTTDAGEVLALDGAKPVDPGCARAAAGAGAACAMSTDGNEVLALDGARPIDAGCARAAAGAGAACAMPTTDADEVLVLDWDKQGGLLPAIVQDADTRRVLMLGWMDRAALAHTRSSGLVTFFSRRRRRLWTKGETSGHTLALVAIAADCDGDALLVQARPAGPTCHVGRASCFAGAPGGSVLESLDQVVASRERERPEGSYTSTLFAAGVPRIAQKVGEEGVEVALAAVTGDDAALLSESADLLFHLAVLLRARGLSLQQAIDVLGERLPAASS